MAPKLNLLSAFLHIWSSFLSDHFIFIRFLFQKIKELTYMHSEGILSGELKHGPLAMIDKDMPCIMVITKDNTYKVRDGLRRCVCVCVCVWGGGGYVWVKCGCL